MTRLWFLAVLCTLSVFNVSQVTRANGVKSTFGYDDLHRLTAIQHKKGTDVLSQFNYTLSADGKRNTLQEYVKYPASQPVDYVNRTVFYGYDNAGRLTAEQRQSTSTLTAGGTIANTARTTWQYDRVGNRVTQAVSNYDGIGVPGDPGATGVLKSTFNTSYTYDNNNNDWLSSTTSVRNDGTNESTYKTGFEYNANGSQTAITSNVGKPDEKTTPYFYDFEQKLTGIGNATDTVRHAYAYDADGNRIAESNTNAGTTDTRNYLVDPNNSNAQIVEEYNNTNKLLAHYDWNDAELLREATRNADESTFTIREPLADGHNSTRQLLDTTGAISDVYSYDAWGNQQVNTGGSFNPYRYNSQRLDASGLYYLRARQYASGIGRFLTHDPLMGGAGNPISQHRYLYAGDDAVNMIDPSGHFFTLGGTFSAMGIISTLGATVGTLATAQFVVAPIIGWVDTSSSAMTNDLLMANNVQIRFPDITSELESVLKRIELDWNDPRNEPNQGIATTNLTNQISGNALGAWDIQQLQNVIPPGDEWIDNASIPVNMAKDRRFVRVDGQTYHSYSVNYVSFGWMMRLAGQSESKVRRMVMEAKWLRPGGGGKDVTSALAWALAGYQGWPDGALTPAGGVSSTGDSGVTPPVFHYVWQGIATFR